MVSMEDGEPYCTCLFYDILNELKLLRSMFYVENGDDDNLPEM